jgi:hypothetical protein
MINRQYYAGGIPIPGAVTSAIPAAVPVPSVAAELEEMASIPGEIIPREIPASMVLEESPVEVI